MTLALGMVTFDTGDAESLATWWAEQTGAELVQNHEGEVARLASAGATLVGRRGDESFRWVTMADPDGNQFCIAADAEAAASY